MFTVAMTQALDSDLVGVVAAAVVVGVLLIIIIAVLAYYCFRRIESERNTVVGRRESIGVVAVTPQWTPSLLPTTIPVFEPRPTILAPEPCTYTLPAFYLGDYRPKYIGMELAHAYKRQAEEERLSALKTTENQLAPQPNGHVAHDFSASNINYRVIRKQHRHERMPDWLRKEYGESSMSLDMSDDSSLKSPLPLRLRLTAEEEKECVRAQVTPVASVIDSRYVLQVDPNFTVVDYVDGDNKAEKEDTKVYKLHKQDEQLAEIFTGSPSAHLNTQSGMAHSNQSRSQQVFLASPHSANMPPHNRDDVRERETEQNRDNSDSTRQRARGVGSVTCLPEQHTRSSSCSPL